MQEAAEARPVWASIDLDALGHNARRAIGCADGRAVIGVVKADGYGHGAAAIARALLGAGVERLAVVSVAEGAALRRAGVVAPVLLLGGLSDPAAAERAAKWSLTPVVHDAAGLEIARAHGRAAAPLAVEVEVDTGMHRMGAAPDAAPRLLRAIVEAPELTLSGVFTHLACADAADARTSRDQVAAFAARLREAELGAASPLDVHVANSAGLLRREEIEGAVPDLVTTAVRPGLMLYGVSPYADRSAEALGLEPVMTLAARVVAVRSVRKGDAVGYGAEWRAERDTRVATLPLGYADGIPRAAAGKGAVHLAGAMRPIVGRVSMDYAVVEVGEAPVSPGDVATVFGRAPDGRRVPVERFAAAAGTIGYEILVGVGARVPRRIARPGPAAGAATAVDAAV